MNFSPRMAAAATVAVGLAATAAIGQDQHILEMEADAEGRVAYEAFDRGFNDAGLFDRWDADGDEALTREELNRGIFSGYDADADDYLDSDETKTMLENWDALLRAGAHGMEDESGDPAPVE